MKRSGLPTCNSRVCLLCQSQAVIFLASKIAAAIEGILKFKT